MIIKMLQPEKENLKPEGKKSTPVSENLPTEEKNTVEEIVVEKKLEETVQTPEPVLEEKVNIVLPEFKEYVRKGVTSMRKYVPGEDLSLISVSPQDIPSLGGMVAVNAKNPKDQWYVAQAYFEENLEEVISAENKLARQPESKEAKSLGNTDVNAAKKNVSDIVFFGNADTFKLVCKASSKAQGWMKSTKAMEISGIGCVVQVTTQQGDNVSEALTFVPKARLIEHFSQEEGEGEVIIGRSLVL
jgi:hypothetical protein